MPISRRDLLRYSVTLGAFIPVSTALTGCALGRSSKALAEVDFTHGVASGDPESGAILLWTRAVPTAGEAGLVGWELSTHPDFRDVVRSGVSESRAERDFTVKVDVRELTPGTHYYYRFLGRSGNSAVGRAQTLPTGAVDELRLAVFSCSNYPAGYFHAYAEAARLERVDAFLHLGDYFYEYGATGYGTERARELGRQLPDDNAGELYSLDDYRKRYALYRSDADLQALHARAPMIAVWDDHEIANDTWREGAQNHSEDEGDFATRRRAAIQAYFEWMPLRPIVPDAEGRIYRSFSFGDLVDLHMLDTRLVGRDQQLEYADYFDAETGTMDSQGFASALTDPERSLLGSSQRAWLYGSLEASQARWQVLGQQVLMARMTMPASLLGGMLRDRDFDGAVPLIDALIKDKAALAAGESLSPESLQRLTQVMPYNLDAWDGYPAEREQLYAVAERLDQSLVVLAGDTHNAWYSELRDRNDRVTGIELATPGVSSPGMEAYLNLGEDQAHALAQALPALIDELQYCDLHRRGFLEVVFTREQVRPRWHFVDSVVTRDYTTEVRELAARA